MSIARKSKHRLAGGAAQPKRLLLRKNLLVRKAASTAMSAARRPFPAWIVADESGVAFPAAVTPRVRSALVLRMVGKVKSANAKRSSDGHRAR